MGLVSTKVRFLVTPVGLMMGNIESARRLQNALTSRGVAVTTSGEEHADILHVHTPIPPSNFSVVRKAKREGVPVVMHAHTTAEDSVGTWSGSGVLSRLTGAYLTKFYNLGDVVLAPSAWTKARLEERGVTAPIRVMSNGVDLSRFVFDQKRRERFRQRYSIPLDATVAYTIGVVCLKKGIEVFPEVARAVPDTTFVWVGKKSGLYHPLRVGSAIRESGGNTRFLHDVEDILDAHCGGDIFFAPSFAENQGMAVMEAMAVGNPVVARDLPSYDRLLEDGSSALLGSAPAEFAEDILRLASDVTARRTLAEKARQSIAAHDIGKVALDLEATYADLLDGGIKSGRGPE